MKPVNVGSDLDKGLNCGKNSVITFLYKVCLNLIKNDCCTLAEVCLLQSVFLVKQQQLEVNSHQSLHNSGVFLVSPFLFLQNLP